jgi:hypothetical protein
MFQQLIYFLYQAHTCRQLFVIDSNTYGCTQCASVFRNADEELADTG